jgi:hypothetical protein
MPFRAAKATMFRTLCKGSVMIYSISYDLRQPGQDYSGLHAAIRSCGDCWHYLGSTWLVDTPLTASLIAAKLRPFLDSTDRLLVIRVTGDSDGWLTPDAWRWINERLLQAA